MFCMLKPLDILPGFPQWDVARSTKRGAVPRLRVFKDRAGEMLRGHHAEEPEAQRDFFDLWPSIGGGVVLEGTCFGVV